MSRNSKQPRWHGKNRLDVEPMQFVISSQKYDRVLYGEGEADLDQPRCNGCGVPDGEFHKLGCDLEPCPRCSGQAITCDCFYEGD